MQAYDIWLTIYHITLRIICGLALLFQGLHVSKKTLLDGISNGEHHGRCGSVAEPHGQERRGQHHSQNEPRKDNSVHTPFRDTNLITALSPKCKSIVFSPCRFHADNTQDLQGYSAMQAPLLNRWGHHKAAKEEKIGFKEVLRAYFFGWKNSQCWEKAHWKYGSDSQGKRLCAPKNSHQQDHIKTFSLLKEKVLGHNGTGLTTTVMWRHQWHNIWLQ